MHPTDINTAASDQASKTPDGANPIVVPVAGYPKNPFAVEILTRVEALDRIHAAGIDPVPRFLDYEGKNEALFWEWCRDIIAEINLAVAELPLKSIHAAATGGEPLPLDDELREEMLAAALNYAAKGKPVFPCDPTLKPDGTAKKKPLTNHGFKDATCDDATIREWWARWPHAMIGMPTGAASGVFVVDLDRKDGVDGRETLAAMGIDDLESAGVETPSGGLHIYYNHRDGLGNIVKTALGPGIDTRGDRGYVIVPPSMWADGRRYEWRVEGARKIADIPQIILDKLEQHNRRHETASGDDGEPSVSERATAARQSRRTNGDARSHAYAEAALDAECAAVSSAVPTTRNATLNNSALKLGQLVAGGELGETQVFDALYAAAIACGLLKDDGPKQVRDTIRSGMRKGMQEPRTAPEPDGRFATRHTDRGKDRADTGTGDAGAKPEAGPDAAQEQTQPCRDDNKPVIEIKGGMLAENVAKVEAALIAAGEPMIFQRNTGIVNIVRLPEKKETRGIRRDAGSPMINIMTTEGMRRRMSEEIQFIKYDARIDGMVNKDPPADYANVLLKSVGQWKFPSLRAVIEAPTLREDGSILQTSGYDPKSWLYYAPSERFEPVPENPTRDDAIEALNSIKDVFKEFPFVDGADGSEKQDAETHEKNDPSHTSSCSVALAAVLTAVVRRSLTTAPMFLFDAPTMGSGKSLLARIIAHIATGRDAGMMSYSGDSDEERKRIMAILLNGDAVILYDNVSEPIEGDALCSVLTSEIYQDRMLGKNSGDAKLIAPTCSTFLATGNNMVVRGDLRTRVLKCRIDPGVERPEERTFDRKDIIAHVKENRSALVAAVLTVLRAYIVADRPPQPVNPFGRFEVWSGLVRNALVWLGCADPCNSLKSIEHDDPVTEGLGAVLGAIFDRFSSNRFTSAEIVNQSLAGADALQKSLEAVLPKGEIKARAIGHYLRKHKDRFVGDLRIRDMGTYQSAVQWKIETKAPQEAK